MATFDIADYKVPLAVRRAWQRKLDEHKRLETEIEWLRKKLANAEEDIASLKNAVEISACLVPTAFKEALERAARLTPCSLGEQIRSIPCPYR